MYGLSVWHHQRARYKRLRRLYPWFVSKFVKNDQKVPISHYFSRLLIGFDSNKYVWSQCFIKTIDDYFIIRAEYQTHHKTYITNKYHLIFHFIYLIRCETCFFQHQHNTKAQTNNKVTSDVTYCMTLCCLSWRLLHTFYYLKSDILLVIQ